LYQGISAQKWWKSIVVHVVHVVHVVDVVVVVDVYDDVGAWLLVLLLQCVVFMAIRKATTP
jgi:hypothetical protein